MSLYSLPPGERVPELVNVVVEIPKGTRNKIEFDPATGTFRLDRVLYASVHYPGDYGFIPGTLSPDGDALDVLVLVTEPTFPGCVLAARPIGVLAMRDEKGVDEKVLAVPAEDPRFGEFDELAELPGHLVKEIEYFFEVYKELEGKETAVLGWEPRASAHAIIERSVRAFRETGGFSPTAP